MAKVEKETKAKKADTTEKMKYGVEDVAEGLGIEPASARVQLRNHDIKKSGKSYGWNSKSEVEEVVKKIKAGNDKPKKVATKKDSGKVTKLKTKTEKSDKPKADKAKVEKKVEKKAAAS